MGCCESPNVPLIRSIFWWTHEPSDTEVTRGASGDVYVAPILGEPFKELAML